MPEAYIVDAVRTPVGRRKGGLGAEHPADLGAHVIKGLVERTGIDPAAVDDVIFGCVDTIGHQAGDIARTCWLAAGLPDSVPGTTVDRQCGSSQQAVHFAAQAVMSGTQDLIVAGGVQQMTQIPISAAMMVATQFGISDPFSGSKGWQARYGGQEVNQFLSAQRIAEKWDLSRAAMEAYSLESHERAIRAQDEGRFDREILPYGDVRADEGPRRGTTLEKMAELKTLPGADRLTAGVASQISDASAALLDRVGGGGEAARSQAARAHPPHQRARGADPIWMLTAPIPATQHALKKAGMSLNDIDLVEINEAFASVVMAWAKDLEADLSKVNVNGGAIALGHPLGATGARLMTTLLHELERTGGRYGLQTMCEGGGQANVTIIERL
jgi:acetyl-CoA C-acetyltransferase